MAKVAENKTGQFFAQVVNVFCVNRLFVTFGPTSVCWTSSSSCWGRRTLLDIRFGTFGRRLRRMRPPTRRGTRVSDNSVITAMIRPTTITMTPCGTPRMEYKPARMCLQLCRRCIYGQRLVQGVAVDCLDTTYRRWGGNWLFASKAAFMSELSAFLYW